MEALKTLLMYAAIGLLILLAGYIAVRIWSYGAFRSYFEAKKQQNHNEKEECKHASTK